MAGFDFSHAGKNPGPSIRHDVGDWTAFLAMAKPKGHQGRRDGLSNHGLETLPSRIRGSLPDIAGKGHSALLSYLSQQPLFLARNADLNQVVHRL
jgi:hypothetical protein